MVYLFVYVFNYILNIYIYMYNVYIYIYIERERDRERERYRHSAQRLPFRDPHPASHWHIALSRNPAIHIHHIYITIYIYVL